MSSIDTIDHHLRSYRSALKSNLEVTINSLTGSFLRMEPLLTGPTAFQYASSRLPDCLPQTEKVILGQNPQVFSQAGFPDVTSWTPVTAPSRRRKHFFNPLTKTLAVFIASITDVDDIVNLLIAYQLEYNKTNTPPLNLKLHLLAGSWIDYTKNIQKWYKTIASTTSPSFHLSSQNIYFVSSNSHSILNLFTGFIPQNQKEIIGSLNRDHPDLAAEWQKIQSGQSLLHPNDFLCFASQFLLTKADCCRRYQDYQHQLGIITIPSSDYLDIDVQIFPIKNILRSPDPRLKIQNPQKLSQSSALIFNIDYPLGFTAYHILKEILENINKVNGVYILGKSAVLNSSLGDLQVPRAVFDEHSENTYLFKNTFNSSFPFTNNQGSILTNQKAVSVLGTVLENQALMDKYSQNDFTVVEMESGPYLSAIAEATFSEPITKKAIVDLNSSPLDIGIINYTSDAPYSENASLSSPLLLAGVEPVYLGSLAILQRIITLEEQ